MALNFKLKYRAARAVLQASRLVSINKLRLGTYAIEPHRYAGLAEGLKALPVPERMWLGGKWFAVPKDMDEVCNNITYGQRMYLTESEGIDVGIILRLVAGYYYPQYTRRAWNEKEALKFGAIVLNSLVKDLYPVATHLTTIMEQLIERERKLLHRTPSKQETAAGIKRLGMFADLTAVIFLQESFNCTAEQVMLAPYNDCLVRFMLAKEQAAYADRLNEVYKREAQNKSKK